MQSTTSATGKKGLLGFSLPSTNPNTVAPITPNNAGSLSSGGSTTPSGLTIGASDPNKDRANLVTGFLHPQVAQNQNAASASGAGTSPVNTNPPSNPLATITIHGDSLGNNPGMTPEEMRKSQGNPTSGAGSLAPGNPNNPPATPATPNTFPGILGATVGAAQGNAPIGQSAADIAARFGQQYTDIGNRAAMAGAGYRSTGTEPVAEGNAAILAQTASEQQTAVAKGEEAALQGTGQQLTAQNQQQQGLLGAAEIAQPSIAAYGQTVFNPVTGQYEGGGGLPPEVMQQYATMAANGQLSQVPASITSNPVLNAQLNAAAKAINPNYNPVISSASAATQATGQQLQTQAQAANSALDTLSGLYNQLGTLGGSTGLKPFNQIEQAIGGLLGNPAVGKYQTTLQEARAKVSGVLSASGGITPTNADAMAKDYLPDGMTPQELPAKIQAAKTLIQQTVDSFVQSGQPNKENNSGGSNGGIIKAGGYDFKQDAHLNWIPA